MIEEQSRVASKPRARPGGCREICAEKQRVRPMQPSCSGKWLAGKASRSSPQESQSTFFRGFALRPLPGGLHDSRIRAIFVMAQASVARATQLARKASDAGLLRDS